MSEFGEESQSENYMIEPLQKHLSKDGVSIFADLIGRSQEK